MTIHCEVTEGPAQPTLSIRKRTSVQDLPQEMGMAYGAIVHYLEKLEIAPSGPPFAAYYNMDIQDLDVEMGFPVPEAVPGEGDIQGGETPGGRAATCLYIGPYTELVSAYETLSNWMREKGYQPSGVAYKMYLNDPNETPPEKLQTQIAFPLVN